MAGGCRPGAAGGIGRGLQSGSGSERIRACIRAGETKDKRALSLLVEQLEDTSGDVRLFAIGALRRMTGQTLGYRYYAPAGERATAVARWRKWLKARLAADR